MAKAPDDLRSLARAYTKAAIETLVAVMQADDATPAARISAANAILERGWGRPTQPVDAVGNDQREASELSIADLLLRAAAILENPEGGDRGEDAREAGSPDLCEFDRDPGSAGSARG